MNETPHILLFVNAARGDSRIRPMHISLYLAFYNYWVENRCSNPVHISRRKIMQTAKIRSIATYHKTLGELCQYRYIIYEPSYDPRYGSAISLLL
ncbi:MAG: hypothetical protein BGO69_04865 [Bacteroidetes bacterium 46-16]|nr:MAG: hypothetical protein BGO69_04865 [Bacteroidetes bacterium 46-16]